MICPHCQFDNLDDKRYCVRCGRFLLTGDIDTTPPRAGGRGRLRHWYYASRRARGFRWNDNEASEIPDEQEALLYRGFLWLRGWFMPAVNRILPGRPPEMRASLWFPGWFIPSLAQFASGRVKRGIAFLSLFVVGLIGWVLLIGSFWWYACLLMIALAYTASCFDYYLPAYRGQTRRILFNAILCAVYFVLVSLSFGYLDNAVRYFTGGVRVEVAYRNAELGAYDIVRVTGQNEYKVGDIVQLGGMPGVYFRTAVYDRLLAGPGETVVIADNRLFAKDGSPWPQEPISKTWMWRNSEVTPQSGQFMVIPSAIRRGLNVAPVVSGGNINGKVTRIIFPWWRRQTL